MTAKILQVTAWASLVFLVRLALFGATFVNAAEPATNLVLNASFEEAGTGSPVPLGWYGPSQVYALDRSMAKTGKASLKYTNADPKQYVLCSQKVPVKAGWKVRIAAWVKTQVLQGSESGATICLEWQDKNGKWLGGAYPAGVKGTKDWTRIETVTRMPEDAASCHVACYVRPEMTGTAWFDDVEVARIADPPMQSVLLAPLYRGRFAPAGTKEARVRVRWNLRDHDLKPQELRVHAAILGQGQQVLQEMASQPKEGQVGFLDLSIPLAGLEPRQYDLAVRLEGPGGKELQTDHHHIECLKEGSKFTCQVDENRRLLVEGKPFFPIGMYWSGITLQDLEEYARSKFNCLMPYSPPTRQQMDLAQRHGLKVIYSVKDWYAGTEGCPPTIRTAADEESMVRARVREFREHPALLA